MKHTLTSYLLIFIFPIFSGIGTSFSQSTAIIGTGTAFNDQYTYPAPYGNWYYGSKHQILVRASEMTAAGMTAGNITKLAFSVNIPSGTALTGFTIRMKATAATTASATFDNTGFVTVYGPQTFTDAAGWNTHTFTTPFYWNGTSNVLIETCFYNSNYTLNSQMYYSTTLYNSVVYYFEDSNPNICSTPSGTVSTNRPNIKFTYTANGPPTSQFSANPTATCSGTVAFTDQSYYSITSWLWNFGDGSTSALQNPTHTYTTSGTYSVSLKVTNSNGNNTLVKPNYISVNLGTGPIAASCNPQTTAYCCGFGITNFKFHNINNTSADASEGYKDFSCGMDTVTTGQTYSISISTQTPAAHNVRVWIDYNNDGIFNTSTEQVFAADNSLIANGTVFIPGNVTLSTPLRMRVSADHNLNPVPGPCSNLQYGQAEDYAIYIKPNTNPPVAAFSADDTLSCSGTINFTDQSQNVPIAWLWNFGDGSTSAQQNPTYTYTANGTYSVSLTATNGNGNNMLVKSNYIHVTLGNIPVATSCQPATFSYCCGYGIYKVQFGTINKSSADASEGYKDFSCTDQTTLTEGQSYNINIQTSPSNVQDTKVWIDFNNDGTFNQANELLLTKSNTINPTGSISIPTGVAVLNTVLRMRISTDNGGSNPGPCTALIRGQAEDYGIKILQYVGVEEVEEATAVTVYPNPFSDYTTLRISNTEQGIPNVELKVFDLVGKEMKVDLSRNAEGFIIHRSGLPSGIYFYTITSNDKKQITNGKLVIQ